jgi:hypothetical protein
MARNSPFIGRDGRTFSPHTPIQAVEPLRRVFRIISTPAIVDTLMMMQVEFFG